MESSNGLVKFPQGSVIVRENELDSCAYLIVSGSVEVYREQAGNFVGIAHLGPGEIFGEMSLVLDRPRTASVKALEDTVVDRIDPEKFARLLTEDSQKIIPFIRLIFERFRSTSADHSHLSGVVRIGRAGSASDAAVSTASSMKKVSHRQLPVLSGKTEVARLALESCGGTATITALPFRIGRKSGGLLADLMSMNDLALKDSPPFQVSRHHCSINMLADQDGYFVMDRGSTLGTIVNGRKIGVGAESNEAPLDLASNELILGGPGSPFVFAISFKATSS